MKKLIGGITLIILAMILLFIVDQKLYFYGKNDLILYKLLPFNVIPQYWGYNNGNLGFVLEQKGETVIAKGMRYWEYPSLIVNEILEYTFDNQKLIALVNDSLGNEYFIICKKTVNTPDFNISVIAKGNFAHPEQYKWIKIKDVSNQKIELFRNILEILVIVLIVITFSIFWKRRKNVNNIDSNQKFI